MDVFLLARDSRQLSSVNCLPAMVNKSVVFVKNIAWATTEDGLKEVFSGCKNVRMPKKPDGASRG